MYRSASTNRVTETSKVSTTLRALSLESSELPTHYEPLSETIKKERFRARFAENSVHLIPLVLLLCALILWFFSNLEMDIQGSSSSATAKLEGLTIDGDIENDVTQTSNLTLELGEIESVTQDGRNQISALKIT
ncbi:OLC1v1027087C1 [Oldenlandia corymbosa var. corymbosa]|uniref:OLC1v1027087C1 n=1 Tax=Oldenlandia corymbosa var. corymbosa TaxID=529605 RepID=A0AAV1CBN8_OLDCO|nr:OLC1v1027087C1 [Oldenlandia corymbosa var. corymbosa]